MEGDKIVQLDPSKVLAEGNEARYSSADKESLDSLKKSISDQGGVMSPVEVEKLAKPSGGHTHKLTTGFRRHQAVLELNKEGAGLTLPAIERIIGDELSRLRRQLAENIERKSMSPMDQAAAIKRLLEAGVSRLDVREMFKRPGGAKGTQLAPASNAWLNMTLSFLDLPKDIRDKIHTGAVGVAAAYELTKVSPERRADVLDRAEKARQADLDREKRDEEKYLNAQKALEDAGKEEAEAAAEATTLQAAVTDAQSAMEAKVNEAAELLKAAAKEKDKEAKAKLTESRKAAEADAKGLEKKLATAKKELDKKVEAQKKIADKAAEMREKLAQQRKAGGKGKGKAVGPGDVQKAAKEAGATTGAIPLKGPEMKKVIEELALPGTPAKVQSIGLAIKSCFDGVTTPGQLLKELAGITGEKLEVGKKKK